MKILVPDYFPEFKCIADKCTDSCCIGWEIDIDGKTLEKYASLGGDLGEEIREKTQHGCFPLDKNGRCAFLDDDGLCRIISGGGEELLCDICREHPRYYGIGKAHIEGGLGLACAEAARIILSPGKRPGFIEIDASPSFVSEDAYAEECDALRELTYGIIYSEPRGKLVDSILSVARYADELGFALACGQETPEFVKDGAELTLDGLLTESYRIFSDCEALGEEWGELLSRAEKSVSTVSVVKAIEKNERCFRNLLFYFTHRYQRESAEDMSMGQRVLLALASSLIIFAISEINGGDLIKAATVFSKNIEYSTDNVDGILDELSEIL